MKKFQPLVLMNLLLLILRLHLLRNPAWTEQLKQGLAYRRMEETAFCSTSHIRSGVLLIGRGVAYRKM